MNINELTVYPMTAKQAKEIHAWKYEGIYSFYTRTDEPPQGDVPERSYVVCDKSGAAVGHFHFGEGGQVPTVEDYDYTPEYLDIGLGLRPDLCGKGMGCAFVRMVAEFAKERFAAHDLRLSVAAFNERAIKVYERVGFKKVCEVTNSYFGNKFIIMVRKGEVA